MNPGSQSGAGAAWQPAFEAAVAAAAAMGRTTRRHVMSKRTTAPPARTASMLALHRLGMRSTCIGLAFGVDTATVSGALARARARLSIPAFAAFVKAAQNAAGPLVPAPEEAPVRKHPEVRPEKGWRKWSRADEERLAALFREGLDAREIGERLGRSPKSIHLRIAELRRKGVLPDCPRQRGPAARPPLSDWTEQRRAEEERSRASLAAKSDEAFLARGWTEREDEIIRDGRAAGLPLREIAARLPGRTKSAVAGRAHRLGLPGAETRDPPPKPRPVFRRAEPGSARGCQWIEGYVPDCLDEHGNAPFCGAPARPGSSYCPVHHARCWAPVPKRGEKAA